MGAEKKLTRRLIRFPELRAKVGLSRTSVWALEKQGKFPKRRAITGSRAVGWWEDEVDTWVSSRGAAAE